MYSLGKVLYHQNTSKTPELGGSCMRAWLLVLAAFGPAVAQISGLVTTGNGAEVYFSNTMPQQGSNAPVQGRIYKVDGNGLQLVADVTKVAPPPPNTISMVFTNYYDLSRPEVSRDGSILAFTGQRTCSGADACSSATTLQTSITDLGPGVVSFTGTGRLSGNGRYLFIYWEGGFNRDVSVVDLKTGQSQVPITPITPDLRLALGYGRVIADDGSAIWAEGDLYILKGTGVTLISRTRKDAASAVIDSSARVAVFSARISSQVRRQNRPRCGFLKICPSFGLRRCEVGTATAFTRCTPHPIVACFSISVGRDF